MSLNAFITHIKQIGLPTASHYEIIVPFVDGTSTSSSQTVSMLCNSATLPGHNIMTTELRIFGEASERPHGINYTPVSLSFIVDNDFTASRYFNNWSNAVFDRESRELGYYDSYTRDVEIVVLNKEGSEIERVKLYEAYPKSVDSLPLDYSNNQVLQLNVQLVYKWWESISTQEEKIVDREQSVSADQYPTYGTEGLDDTSETLGNSTSNTPEGRGIDINPGIPSFGDPGTAFQQAGANISSNAKRGFLQAENLFGVSSMSTPEYPSAGGDLSSLSTTLSTGFSGFGDSISSLAGTGSISGAMTQMQTSLNSVAISSSNVANLLTDSGGDGSVINQNVAEILRVSSYLPSVSNRAELPGYLNSISASMSSIGSQITNMPTSLRSNPSFDRSAEVGLQYMGSVFNTTGSIVSQATISLSK